jgi:X-Pro dipeptidyl-peptidase
MARIVRSVATAGVLILVSALVAPPGTARGAAPADRAATPSWLSLADGVSRAQFSTAEIIEEVVYVETPVDTDGDGARDRVRLTVLRPGETDSRGLKVPVIFEHSPYRFGTNGAPNHDVDVDVLPQESLRRDADRRDPGRALAARDAARLKAARALPAPQAQEWVSRGYAVVYGESIGTAGSDGCPTVGDRREMLGAKAIIDWLNGRARGRYEAGGPAVARWSTGDVGMTGISYDGTLANMVATTGVEGLRTIVPVSAISSWYDYYRANGLVRAPHSGQSGEETNVFQGEDLDVLGIFTQGESRFAKCAAVTADLLANQDRVTGDYSPYWHERDWLHRARGVRSSVLVVHGLEDYNVMGKAYASWWERLRRHHVPRKIWLHAFGHGPDFGEAYDRMLHLWFDHWLLGVDNGVMDEPTATVQRPDGTYDTYRNWPVPGSAPAVLRLGADRADAPGTLSTRAPSTRAQGGARTPQSFLDRGRELDTDTALLPGPDAAHPNRLVYRSAPLGAAAHLSGTPTVSLRVSVDNRRAANLTAVLVDYPPAGSAQPPVMVTRGWVDPQNRASLSDGAPLRPGRPYTIGWDMQPDDYVFPAGHRIGLVIVSTDHDYTLRPLPGTELTVYPAQSRLVLPLVRGDRWASP